MVFFMVFQDGPMKFFIKISFLECSLTTEWE
jgi:hypothetical protein